MSNKPEFIAYLCSTHNNGNNVALYRSTHPDKQINQYFARYETVPHGNTVPGFRCPTFRTQSEALKWYESFGGSGRGQLVNAVESTLLPEDYE